MKPKYRVCLADDHTILREGLRTLISMEPTLEVVGEMEHGLALIRNVQRLRPDLILLDLHMPRINGLEAIPEIKKRHPGVKILVLTVHDAEEYVLAAFREGANGYLLKDVTRAELMMAIHSVLAGRVYLSSAISDKVIKAYLEAKAGSGSGSTFDTLTHRERQILKLVAEGFKNKEIAGYLYISIKTVEKHRANLMKKLDRHSTAALTAFAIEHLPCKMEHLPCKRESQP